MSAIVPVYNGAGTLAEAIESILAQEFRPLDIIVVDDGSTDATSEVVKRFADRVIAIRQDNLGPGAARNAGIARTARPFVAFLDADDVWPATALASHLDSLAAKADAAVAWGQSTHVVRAGGSPPRDDWHGRPQWALSVGSMLFRRSVFDEVGAFDPALRVGEDLDLMLRIVERRIVVERHAHVVCERRFHPGNVTRDEAAVDWAYFSAVKKAFARRRSAAGRKADPRT
ncbi:MAG: glycosyltransferase family A protein [Acidobacteriota bacterium]